MNSIDMKATNAVHEGKKPFGCDKCDRKFTSEKDLKRHISEVHEGTKPFECEFCDRKFSRKDAVKHHIAQVHEGKLFKCD